MEKEIRRADRDHVSGVCRRMAARKKDPVNRRVQKPQMALGR